MRVSVSKSEVSGKVTIPSSKSYTIRGVICASLASGVSEILSPLASDDTDAAMEVMTNIGIKIEPGEAMWRVHGGDFVNLGRDLFCRESATTYRFMTAIASLVPGRNHLVPGPGLAKRPVGPLTQSLKELGVKCQVQKDASLIIEGPVKGGETRIVGNISSQYISALLLVSPLALSPVKIMVTTHLESIPFIYMTMEYLEKFGVKVKATKDLREFEIARQEYKPARFRIEGDWTSASYFLTLGAALGEIELKNLNPESLQGDRIMMKFLADMGARVRINQDSITIGKGRGNLTAVKADMANCIDLLPTVGVAAAFAEGTSELTGIARARIKESNRVSALRDGLVRMGAKVVEEENRLLITGGGLKGAVIDTYNDHRIAMAFSILGAVAGNTVINGAECVAKTFPEYWDLLKSAGVRMETDE